MKRRKKASVKFFSSIVLLIIILISGVLFFDIRLRPTILAMSEVRARMIATQAINEAIKTRIKEDIKYQDLIFTKTDSEGNVTMMQANTVLMNSIASDVALEVQENMKQMTVNSIRVPLGNAIDSQIFSQYGPKITIDIVPQGTVTVDFATEFKESGINQTIHKVYLVINTDVKIVVPLVSDTVSISATVPIAETIIVGDVPETYIFVPKDDVLNVVPSN